jgi:hypothetical protein
VVVRAARLSKWTALRARAFESALGAVIEQAAGCSPTREHAPAPPGTSAA